MITLLRRLFAVPKMLKDPNVRLSKKLTVIGALVYVFSPLDVIPDPILGFGIIDDAALIAYIVSMIKEELDKYTYESKKVNIEKDKIVDNVDYKIEDE